MWKSPVIAVFTMLAMCGNAMAWEAGYGADGSVSAVASAGDYGLGLQCAFGELRLVYYFPEQALAPEIASSVDIDMVILDDAGASQAVHTKLSRGAGTVTAGFRGDPSADWGWLAARAASSVTVGLGISDGAGQLALHNMQAFSATGSAAALKPVLQACGK